MFVWEKKQLLWWNRSDLISEVCFAFGLSKKNQNMNWGQLAFIKFKRVYCTISGFKLLLL